MSVINRIEVANLLNQQRDSENWNPVIDHLVFDLRGHSTVFQMENAKGKTTLTEGLTALLSRSEKRLQVIQSRMAHEGCGVSHIRLELIITDPSAPDMFTQTVDERVKGEPWVLGMYGQRSGDITFYSYQGTLEETPILERGEDTGRLSLQKLQTLEAMINSARDAEFAVPRDRWVKTIVPRHLEPEAVKELTRLAEQGGAEKAKDFFGIKRDGRSFDAAFFYHQIAPDLIDDLLTTEGEEEERLRARRRGERFSSDSKFENQILNTVLNLIETDKEIEERKAKITGFENALTTLNTAVTLCESIVKEQSELDETKREVSLNWKVLQWLMQGSLPGKPVFPDLEEPLKTIVAHCGLSKDKTIVMNTTGCAFLFGKSVGHSNEVFLRANASAVENSQVIEIYCDSSPLPSSAPGPKIKWFTLGQVEEALKRMDGNSFKFSKAETISLLDQAKRVTFEAFALANPLLSKTTNLENEKKIIRERISRHKNILDKKSEDLDLSIKDKENIIKQKENEEETIKIKNKKIIEFRSKYNFSSIDESIESIKNERTIFEDEFSDYSYSYNSKNNQIKEINKNNFNFNIDERLLSTIGSTYIEKSISISRFLENYRATIQSDTFTKLVSYFGSVLSAPVLEDPSDAAELSVRIALNNLAIPVFLKRDLEAFLSQDMNATLMESGKFVHHLFGAERGLIVDAFIDPKHLENLVRTLTSDTMVLNEKRNEARAKMQSLTEDLQLGAEVKRYLEEDTDTRLSIISEELEHLRKRLIDMKKERDALKSASADQGASRDRLYDIDKEAVHAYWQARTDLDTHQRNEAPWTDGFLQLFDMVKSFENALERAQRGLRQREFETLVEIQFDAEKDDIIRSAQALKQAVDLCAREGRSFGNELSRMRAKEDLLSLEPSLQKLQIAEKSLNLSLDRLEHIITEAITDAAGKLPTLLCDKLERNRRDASIIPGLVAQLQTTLAKETELNSKSKKTSENMRTESVKALANRIQRVRSRKKLLDKAMTEGPGTKFEIDVTIPSRDKAENVFAGLFSMGKKQNIRIARQNPDLSPNEHKRKLASAIKTRIRETLRDQVLINPKVSVIHKKFNYKPKALEDPSPDNPKHFSNGENTSISLAWMIRKARYARERGLLNAGYKAGEVARMRQNTSSFILLDGLFSDMSDKELTKGAMEPLMSMKGEFQIFGLVHAPEYIAKHDPVIFPNLIVGGINGGRWRAIRLSKDDYEKHRSQEGTWGLVHMHFESLQ
ncbi:hypothetical protein [Thalassospira xiamenensis]|uniref:Uncharacterized protein n=1 Tax=Thalassospira xiamenensis TaxID=220697 RepID=A0A367XB15_9PROT|nr:hypothetical protein [Thalassospira xiamenensis]KZB53031.1 hypothetical protein AUP41_03065 [Thalassospira xiamenensis]RCK50649.1 hypothetical protein TH44_11780 [Thalassospira xiamenensis]